MGALHHDVDIDHVIPLKLGGKDGPSNFALTHSSCNRSKQDSDLRVARILNKFSEISEETFKEKRRSPNLNDVLSKYDGAKYQLKFKIENDKVKISFPDLANNDVYKYHIFKDKLAV